MEFAFGLTKTVVEATVSKAKSAIEEEEKLKEEVQHELEFITAEFQMMQSFLNNAANRDRAGESEVARTWLRLLRDLAFDVEDWVEFVAHMDKVGSTGALCRRLMQACPCLAQSQDLDVAAAEIKLLKARVENVSQRSKRYNIIPSSDSSSSGAGGSRSISNKPAATATAMPAEQMVAGAAVSPLAFGILRKAWEAAGKPCAMLNLQKIIATEGGHELQVISVWGSTGGDLGMTSTIREAYCDTHIGQEFRARAWVKMAHPFNLHDFLDSLLTQLLLKSSHHHGDGDAAGVGFRPARVSTEDDDDGLMKQLLLLMKEKYLVVLEDVSTVVQWDAIKMYLPDCKNGSRIVVSTHDIGMAFMCTGKPYLVSELRRFPDGHSLCAFFRKARESPIDINKFIQAITCPSVVSVWGRSRTKSIVVDTVYRDIIMLHNNKQEEEHDGRFETYGWVHVPDYWFDLRLISRQLYLDLCSYGGSAYNDETKHANETVDAIEEAALIQKCCEFLREKDCLVVIDGLRYTKDWDLFRKTFLSKPIKGCIIIITNEENVAKHCADPKDRVFNIKDDPEASAAEIFSIRKEKARTWTKTAEIVESNQRLALDFSFLPQDPGGVVSVWGVTGVGKKPEASTFEIFSIRKEKARTWTKTAEIVESHQQLALNFSMLLQEPGGVVSVWGLTGVGKKYLVRTSYYHHMLRSWGQLFTVNSQPIWLNIRKEENHRDEFAAFSWVHVPCPFSLMTFSRRLLMDFYSDDLQAMEAAAVGIMQGQDLYEECRKILRAKKYFVVIDGLQSTDEWDTIKQEFFPRRVDGCVVVITHEAKVARHCQVDEARRVNVRAFQADEARNLFMKVVWKNKQLNRDEMKLSKRILSKCGGLPKIINAIGEHCSRSSTDQLKHINVDFMGSLESNDPEFRRLRGLFSRMKNYFDYDFSDTLKPCIFYLSVFPVDHNIRWRRLLRRWIAEGYCRDKASTTVEEEGKMLLSELINLSIIQVQHTPRKILELNGFFREYLVSRPMEGNLVFALKGKCSVNSQRAGQHLTIRSNWDRDKIVFENINFSKLRSLTVSGEWRSFFISDNNSMRLLRVLDLENSSGVTDDDLEQIVKLLRRLKFLSLRGCREITCLPDSLGGLRQLHTLDIRYTSILVLPRAIIKLENLQYINAGTTEPWDLTSPPEAASEDWASTSPEEQSLQVPAADEAGTTSTPPSWSSRARQLVSGRCLAANKFHRHQQGHHDGSIKVPAGIGKLTALQALGVVNVSGAGRKAVSKELKKLTQLRKLRVSGIRKENYQELFSAISGHAHLESLSVRLEKDQEGGFCCLDGISEHQRPRYLKSLKMYGHVHKLPTWMKQLDHLSKVDLEMTITEQQGTCFYEQLPAQIIQGRISVKAVEMGQVNFGAPEDSRRYPYWNKQFQVFKIDCTSRLQVTFTDDYITRSVELLVVHFSSGSSLTISGLEHLDKLKEVWLKGSYRLELWQQLKQQLSKHPNKPVLKPEQPLFVCWPALLC